jgi:hypothetical protein
LPKTIAWRHFVVDLPRSVDVVRDGWLLGPGFLLLLLLLLLLLPLLLLLLLARLRVQHHRYKHGQAWSV